VRTQTEQHFLRTIMENEELLVNYNYSLSNAPDWYKEKYFQHLREEENVSEEELHSLAKRKSKQFQTRLQVPPPPKGSNRSNSIVLQWENYANV